MTDKISNTINKHLIKISNFIEDDTLENAKEQLLNMFYAALTSRHMHDLEEDAKEDLAHFYIVLLGLVEGIHWLGDAMMEAFRNSLSGDMNEFKLECPYGCKKNLK